MKTPEGLLEEFGRYWDKKERLGEVSRLDALEQIVIKLFARWLLEHYQLEKKS